MELEIRLGSELSTSDEGAEKGFEGRLVPYNSFAPIGGTFEEAIAPGCFRKSITEAANNLPLMAIHDHKKWPIGRSVEWDDKADGLWGRWVMADTDQAREAYKLIQAGIVQGLSCGFVPIRARETWEPRRPPELSRVTRKEARLVEASVVPIPTWPEARITVTRSGVMVDGDRLTPRAAAWAEWLETVRTPAG